MSYLKKTIGGALLAGIGLLIPGGASAESNPIFKDAFTADPAPMIYKDTVYVYVGQDEGKDGATGGDVYNMTGWRCYSSKDMKTWTSHGSVLKPTDFKWAIKDAWASQVVAKDGKFYYYVTVQHDKTHNGKAVGVAVADSPTGPFTDARGTALVTEEMTTGGGWNDIDPTVLIDDDGTAWMAWGNGTCFIAKLKPNMTELDGEIRTIKLPSYVEGPWLHKHKDTYYLIYAGFGKGAENIQYATAPKITGPWTPRGVLIGSAKNSFTTHPGVIDFKGQGYAFYHNGMLTLNGQKGSGGRRSVCLDYMYYNPDGTLQLVTQTVEGVDVPPSPPTTDTTPSTTTLSAQPVELQPMSKNPPQRPQRSK
ncbi:TPA: glycoside hydrolase [Candidatus Sumerlaeota bacterium]|nr:glycoside hydrolase [Candidatus Sumerlaeota bacterium]